jgi:M3 family oligoendopeptidase
MRTCNIDQNLRISADVTSKLTDRKFAFAQNLQELQRCQLTITRCHMIQEDNVSGLLAAKTHVFLLHHFQNIPVTDCQWPTMESAEIASMSMEFNAWPWSHLFFKEDTEKYHFLHLSGALKFLPYGVLVDHFQHEVYDHPDMTPAERKQCWRTLEKMYQPYKDYEGAPMLEKGCWWYQQGHIFEAPFYYIDYTLAQVCALQFWARNHRNDPESWKDYTELCRCGGTLAFTDLVRHVHLKVPFEDGCLKDTVREVNAYLDSVDDTAL